MNLMIWSNKLIKNIIKYLKNNILNYKFQMGKFKFQKDSKDNKKSNKISNHLHILN